MQHREGHTDGPAAEQHRGQKEHSAHPLRHTAMKAMVLPALADTLGLSTDQKRRLEELQTSFLSEQKAHREELHSEKKALHEFMRGDMPEPAAVREQLTVLATKRAELKAAPYEAAMEMREVLTDEQRGRLDELSPRARRHEVMAHMTMKEHMHIKRALHGGQHEGAGRHGKAGHHGKAGQRGGASPHGEGGQHGAGEHEGHESAGPMKHHGPEEDERPGHRDRRSHLDASGDHSPGPHASSAMPLQEPGQSIFGTVQEAIQKLERDPETDWSQVDVGRLRRHLLDMHNVAVNVHVRGKEPIENGVHLTVRPTSDSARASLERVLAAHPPMLEREVGWHMDVSEQDGEFVLRVTDPSGEATEKIRALGYIGLLASGAHHQRHHWMLVRGRSPDSH